MKDKGYNFYNLNYAVGCICSSDRTKKLKDFTDIPIPDFSCLTGHHMTFIDIDDTHELNIPIIVENCNHLSIVVRKDGILIKGKPVPVMIDQRELMTKENSVLKQCECGLMPEYYTVNITEETGYGLKCACGKETWWYRSKKEANYNFNTHYLVDDVLAETKRKCELMEPKVNKHEIKKSKELSK